MEAGINNKNKLLGRGQLTDFISNRIPQLRYLQHKKGSLNDVCYKIFSVHNSYIAVYNMKLCTSN